jgi:hypothetical protein
VPSLHLLFAVRVALTADACASGASNSRRCIFEKQTSTRRVRPHRRKRRRAAAVSKIVTLRKLPARRGAYRHVQKRFKQRCVTRQVTRRRAVSHQNKSQP